MEHSDYEPNIIKNLGTGGHDFPEGYKILPYSFGRYQIMVKLTPSNKFIGIVEIKVNKEFLSHKQKTASQGFHDVAEFYRK